MRWWMVLVFVVGDGIIRGLAQHNVRAQEGQDIGSIQIIENASAELAAASAAEGEIAVASATASTNPHLSFCLHRKPCGFCVHCYNTADTVTTMCTCGPVSAVCGDLVGNC